MASSPEDSRSIRALEAENARLISLLESHGIRHARNAMTHGRPSVRPNLGWDFQMAADFINQLFKADSTA